MITGKFDINDHDSVLDWLSVSSPAEFKLNKDFLIEQYRKLGMKPIFQDLMPRGMTLFGIDPKYAYAYTANLLLSSKSGADFLSKNPHMGGLDAAIEAWLSQNPRMKMGGKIVSLIDGDAVSAGISCIQFEDGSTLPIGEIVMGAMVEVGENIMHTPYDAMPIIGQPLTMSCTSSPNREIKVGLFNMGIDRIALILHGCMWNNFGISPIFYE